MALSFYSNTITQRSGQAIPNARASLLDADGDIVPIYSDKSGTAIAGNEAVANDDGFLFFFFNAAAGQQLSIMDSDGNRLFIIDDIAQSSDRASHFGTIAISAVDGLSDKLNRTVYLEDYLAVAGGNASNALALASANAAVVRVRDSHSFTSKATVAANTTVILEGATLSAASGYTDHNLLVFAGNGGISGGTLDLTNLATHTGAWPGDGETRASGIYSTGASLAARVHSITVTDVVFRNSPGGPIFVKWLASLTVRGCTFTDCQQDSVQYKATGSYANVPTTNTLGNERLTGALVEAYRCVSVTVDDCTLSDIRAKGTDIAADRSLVTRCRYSGGTPRHTMEHYDGAVFISQGNFYNGGADRGVAIKAFASSGGAIGGHEFRSVSIAIYLQDTSNVTFTPSNGVDVDTPLLLQLSNVATASMVGIGGPLGQFTGSGSGSAALRWAGDAAATSYHFQHSFEGDFTGFEYPCLNTTPGIAIPIDLKLVATFRGCTAAADLRIRNLDIDATFKGHTGTAASIGNLTGVTGGAVNGTIRVNDNSAANLVTIGAQALYDCTFGAINLDVVSVNGGTRAVAFGLDGSDALGLLNINIKSQGIDGVSGVAAYFDFGGKAVKLLQKMCMVNGAGTPMNYSAANVASVTGLVEKGIYGSNVGTAYPAGVTIA